MYSARFCFFVAFLAIAVLAVTKEEARNRLDHLLEESRMHGQKGLSWLNKETQLIRERAIVVSQEGARAINQENRRYLGEFTDIDKGATAVGKNASACLNSKESLFNELVELASLELVACVDRFADQAIEVVNGALVQFNRIIGQVEQLAPALEACANEACIETVVTKIAFEETDCPRRFEEEIDLRGNKAEANMLIISECGTRQAERLVNQANTILADVEKCVDKLIHG